jgi:hypothetical protein
VQFTLPLTLLIWSKFAACIAGLVWECSFIPFFRSHAECGVIIPVFTIPRLYGYGGMGAPFLEYMGTIEMYDANFSDCAQYDHPFVAQLIGSYVAGDTNRWCKDLTVINCSSDFDGFAHENSEGWSFDSLIAIGCRAGRSLFRGDLGAINYYRNCMIIGLKAMNGVDPGLVFSFNGTSYAYVTNCLFSDAIPSSVTSGIMSYRDNVANYVNTMTIVKTNRGLCHVLYISDFCNAQENKQFNNESDRINNNNAFLFKGICLIITDCMFDGLAIANGDGGAVYFVVGGEGWSTITRTSFTSCSASHWGGCFYVSVDSIVMNDVCGVSCKAGLGTFSHQIFPSKDFYNYSSFYNCSSGEGMLRGTVIRSLTTFVEIFDTNFSDCAQGDHPAVAQLVNIDTSKDFGICWCKYVTVVKCEGDNDVFCHMSLKGWSFDSCIIVNCRANRSCFRGEYTATCYYRNCMIIGLKNNVGGSGVIFTYSVTCTAFVTNCRFSGAKPSSVSNGIMSYGDNVEYYYENSVTFIRITSGSCLLIAIKTDTSGFTRSETLSHSSSFPSTICMKDTHMNRDSDDLVIATHKYRNSLIIAETGLFVSDLITFPESVLQDTEDFSETVGMGGSVVFGSVFGFNNSDNVFDTEIFSISLKIVGTLLFMKDFSSDFSRSLAEFVMTDFVHSGNDSHEFSLKGSATFSSPKFLDDSETGSVNSFVSFSQELILSNPFKFSSTFSDILNALSDSTHSINVIPGESTVISDTVSDENLERYSLSTFESHLCGNGSFTVVLEKSFIVSSEGIVGEDIRIERNVGVVWIVCIAILFVTGSVFFVWAGHLELLGLHGKEEGSFVSE